MRIEHVSPAKLKKNILKITSKYLSPSYKVFIFGSRLKNRGSERSDIDLGIEGPKTLSLKTLGKIKEEVENLPFLYTIDVVDFKTVSPDFYKVAKEKIEPINND